MKKSIVESLKLDPTTVYHAYGSADFYRVDTLKAEGYSSTIELQMDSLWKQGHDSLLISAQAEIKCSYWNDVHLVISLESAAGNKWNNFTVRE